MTNENHDPPGLQKKVCCCCGALLVAVVLIAIGLVLYFTR